MHADFVELPTIRAVGNLKCTHIIHFAYPPRTAHQLGDKRTDCICSFLLVYSRFAPSFATTAPRSGPRPVKRQLQLSHLNKKRNEPTNSNEASHFEISRKPIHRIVRTQRHSCFAGDSQDAEAPKRYNRR
jgi:hypothetical protein